MVAGQVADMGLCELPEGQDGWDFIHMHKTADMVIAAVRMGAICGNADGRQMKIVGDYGRAVGLAFQLVDDILDVTGQVENLGKTLGKDQASGKQTHVGQLGLDKARALADELTAQGARAAGQLGPSGAKLRELAELLAERSH